MTKMTKNWDVADRKFHIHPKTNPVEYKNQGGVNIVKANGVHLWDDRGVRYIDGVAGLANVNIGYGNSRMRDAITRQLDTLSYFHTFTGFANPPSAMLSEKLAQIMPAGMNRFYYISSGSEAIDTAVKIAHYYWKRIGKPTKKVIISRKLAYHGCTMYATALTGMEEYYEQFHLPLADIRHIEAPYKYQNGHDLTEESYAKLAASRLREAIEREGAENVAAFIAEPIQASGGVITPPTGYWSEIRAICEKYDILYISDEVITGFGRLGHWLGGSQYNYVGDIVAMAKGISSAYVPMGAVGMNDKVADVIQSADEYFMHGFSATGHPVACAATLENISIIEDEHLLENVRTGAGQALREGLKTFTRFPFVAEVRAVGMAMGIELDPSAIGITSGIGFDYPAAILTQLCRNFGLIVRGDERVLLMSPPLSLDTEEVQAMLAVLEAAFTAFPAAVETI